MKSLRAFFFTNLIIYAKMSARLRRNSMILDIEKEKIATLSSDFNFIKECL